MGKQEAMEKMRKLCGRLTDENEGLRKQLVKLEDQLFKEQEKVNAIQGKYKERYRLAEKAVVALIMDASYGYGPVNLTISHEDENWKMHKSIVLRTAPDGVIRALMDSDLVPEVRLESDGIHIEMLPEAMDAMFGV